jgi:LuxR family maltose regulon positive regulatory protein
MTVDSGIGRLAASVRTRHGRLDAASTRPVGERARRGLVVERPRLLERLSDAVADVPVTLVCAPAGSGKTVLAARWAEVHRGLPVGWMNVADRDNDPRAFWWHVRSALGRTGVLERGTLGRADEDVELFPGADDADRMGHQLLGTGRSVVLVLDGVHRLQQRDVFDGLAGLLDTTDGRLRVVITTRHEPPLPLHRYRLEGTLAELGTDELAFTRAEVDALLELHQLRPTDEVTRELLDRTEGWAAGARLAALALRSDGDVTKLGRLATDYLAAEVLDTLSNAEQDLLRRVSIAHDVSPGLAAALSRRPDAEAVLHQLARRNAFVRPVRGRPRHHRIHPLFRELLTSQRSAMWDGGDDDLHRTASDWFGSNGELLPAVDHAAAAGDWARAAAWTVRLHGVIDLLLATPGSALATRLEGMPARGGPDVHLVRAALALGHGDLDSAREHLDAIPAACQDVPQAGSELDPGDDREADTEAERLDPMRLVWVAILRARLGEQSGDVEAILRATGAARGSLPSIGENTEPRVAALAALLACSEGTAYLHAGRLDTACAALDDAVAAATAGGRAELTLGCLSLLALAEALRGRLSHAQELADDAGRLAEGRGAPSRPAALGLAQAWVSLERQDLARARQALCRGGGVGGGADSPLLRSVLLLLRARLKRDSGHGVNAKRLLQHADPPVGWLRRSFDDEAAAVGLLARDSEPGPDAMAGLRAVRMPTSATDQASAQVEQLLEDARIHRVRGDARASHTAIAEALARARGECLRRPFAHAAPEVRALIRTDSDLRARADWLRPQHLSGSGSETTSRDRTPVVEQLSERELQVLRHLAALLTTEEIAAEMFISPNTVRTHVRRILAKLSASRRHEAVRRARALGLI